MFYGTNAHKVVPASRRERRTAMQVNDLHPWDVTYREAVAIQQALKQKLVLCEDDSPCRITSIAGADLSYSKRSDLFFASVILLSWPSLSVIEEASSIGKASFPYIPGLLSFREGPALLKAFNALRQTPDCVIFDGHGIAHPRNMGLASHMGIILGLPSIGCAKKRLVGFHDEVGCTVGDYTALLHDEQIVGAVLRTKARVKPVFISQGHKIGLKRAVEVILSCCRGYRLPEPVRLAHLAVNRLRASHGS